MSLVAVVVPLVVEAGEGPPERERGEMGGVDLGERDQGAGEHHLQLCQRTDLELYYFAWK